MQHAVERIASYFSSLTPAGVTHLDRYYTPDAYFRDPFNEVCGVPAIAAIFNHMFEALQDPRFVITDRIVDGDRCFLAWEFHFAFRGRGQPAQLVRGGSHLLLAADGRICSHCDYWDAAGELYEKLPLLGVLMRWLRRRMAG